MGAAGSAVKYGDVWRVSIPMPGEIRHDLPGGGQQELVIDPWRRITCSAARTTADPDGLQFDVP